jgi:CBS domain containing-hemolysin-like protein
MWLRAGGPLIVHVVLGALAPEPHWVWDILFLLSIPALILLNGLFVAAEFSLVAVRRTRVEQLVNEGVRKARYVESAIAGINRSIAATQLGITLASIALGFVGEPALARLLQPLLQKIPDAWRLVTAHTLAITIAFLLITFMHVVFGELIPKTIALQVPERLALLLARPLLVFTWLTRPFTVAMNVVGNALLRKAGYTPASGENMIHTVEELLLLIEDTEEAGLIDPEQADLVENVFELSGKRVRDCLVPRDKMATLDLNAPPEQILEVVRQGAHTRLPVYEGDLDNIVGIVNTKDLFYIFSLKGVIVLGDALYPPLYLKPDENMANALRVFKRAHRPMALVRDDKGSILGLITLEDVLEEIVGDIEDEHDRPTPRLVRPVRRPSGVARPALPAPKPAEPAKNKDNKATR